MKSLKVSNRPRACTHQVSGGSCIHKNDHGKNGNVSLKNGKVGITSEQRVPLTATATDDSALDNSPETGPFSGTPGAALPAGLGTAACGTEDSDVNDCILIRR